MSGFRPARVNLGGDFPRLGLSRRDAAGNKVHDFSDFHDF